MQPYAFPPRAERLARLGERGAKPFDALVVGGGATGAGVALDLVARGLEVLLIERGDWAGSTSSSSSRLIHGGLRYLERFDLALVRESCLERALLLDLAAGLVWPERFAFPLLPGGRVGRLKLFAGLWLYTALSAPHALGRPGLLSARELCADLPGVAHAGGRGAGTYLDAATLDARLVLAVVKSASRAGALTLSRVELKLLEQGTSGVSAQLCDHWSGASFEVQARSAVLCGGPHTDSLRRSAGLQGAPWIAATRGSHILVPRERLPTRGALIFDSAVDGRVMFLLPWPRYTAIGTTDLDAAADTPPRATRVEVRYLLDSANALVPGAKLAEEDVLSTWSGLRPLLKAPQDNPSARTREERIECQGRVFSIAGGKLTGYRSMAEHLGAALCRRLDRGDRSKHSPTRRLRLVDAQPKAVGVPDWSDPRGSTAESALRQAFERRYAASAAAVSSFCKQSPQGELFLDSETLLGELDWAVQHDDCLAPADFLLRRTDLGRGPAAFSSERIALVERVLSARHAQLAPGWAPELASGRTQLQAQHAWREDALGSQS